MFRARGAPHILSTAPVSGLVAMGCSSWFGRDPRPLHRVVAAAGLFVREERVGRRGLSTPVSLRQPVRLRSAGRSSRRSPTGTHRDPAGVGRRRHRRPRHCC
ncbi:hypothetical protein HBB16_11890 [Pseudonocardia sp. MCCB 268]|nr:hypothetical protein [Pseudonocardia cytotoxica]